MKNKIIFVLLAFAGLAMMGCNDGFLDRTPETSLAETNFFKTESDLALYSNQFYSYYSHGQGYYTVGPYYGDGADNVVLNNFSARKIYQSMGGSLTPNNCAQWDWSKIRVVNFMIARAGKAAGENVKHYIGAARLNRAYLYYVEKVLRYSDVPWYSRDLQTNDTELLYKTQDSRAAVVDSVFADFGYAIANMRTIDRLGNHGRALFSKELALAFAARCALYEASWRKYHPELKLESTADAFFRKAIGYCEQLMDDSNVGLCTKGLMAGEENVSAYLAVCRNKDLADNPEAIFYEDCNFALGKVWWNSTDLCLSRDLMETYLYVENGSSKPFTQVSGYDRMGVDQVFRNRDPRLADTFWTPGKTRFGLAGLEVPSLVTGGYMMYKTNALLDGSNQSGSGSGAKCYADIPIVRFNEILLTYAEAKAELGQLSQSDLDKSVNLLRDRVGMPRATLASWLGNVDPVLAAKYPHAVSTQLGAVLEIRRERRVELAMEGFRAKDLFRWGEGQIFEEMLQQGITLPDGYGAYDLTADGVPDVLVLEKKADKDNYAEALAANPGIVIYAVEDGQIELKDNHIQPQGVNNLKFTAPRDYYHPISTQDILINPNLIQIPSWK